MNRIDGEVTRRLISSGSPFEKQVGYSRAVVDGDWCFVAGTTGYDPVTKVMPESAAEKAKNALGVIEKALVEAGFAPADEVRATSYLPDTPSTSRPSCRVKVVQTV